MKHTILTIINEALPYAAGAACVSITWTLLGWGVSPVIASLVGAVLLITLVLATTHKVLQKEKHEAITELPSPALPIRVQKDTYEGTDEVPHNWGVSEVSILEDTAPFEFEPIKELPAEALIELEEESSTVPEIVHIKIFVNGKYIRTMRFPSGRRILENEEGMVRHARKYSDVAAALRSLTITSQSYRPGNGVYFTASE